MQQKLMYSGGAIALIVASGVAVSVFKPDVAQEPSEGLVEIPTAATDAGNQYGFSAGNSMADLCIDSGMGEITLSSSNPFAAHAPFSGKLQQLVTKEGCKPCYTFTSPFSQFRLKICGAELTPGEYLMGDELGRSKEFTVGLFGPIQSEPGQPRQYQPAPPEAQQDRETYLSRVFPR